MPEVNPEILVWARKTAGIEAGEAAKRLRLGDSKSATAAQKLEALEAGRREPSRATLVRMGRLYRRPLVVFYLAEPPRAADRGADFRGSAGAVSPEEAGRLDALLRNIRSRQALLRGALEEEEEDHTLAFVGSLRQSDGRTTAVEALRTAVGLDLREFRRAKGAGGGFEVLRASVERAGVCVLLQGDLGNHHTRLDVDLFRGFAVSDPVAPFVVINPNDARAAWSFTLLHEMTHLLLGQTGYGNRWADTEVERFCDDAAGEYLLPTDELRAHHFGRLEDIDESAKEIARFAEERNLSAAMVAYRAHRTGLLTAPLYRALADHFRARWLAERSRRRTVDKERTAGPSFYTVRRHRLGKRLPALVRGLMRTDALSTTRAARVLDVGARQVAQLLA